MRENKRAGFFDFLTTKDPHLRVAAFYLPLAIASGTFVLNWLVREQGLSESLFASALMFLIVCFIGVVSELVRHKGPR
jgi:hypothetical protein